MDCLASRSISRKVGLFNSSFPTRFVLLKESLYRLLRVKGIFIVKGMLRQFVVQVMVHA